MKPILIMIAHDRYAEQLKKSAEMIMGKIDGLYTVPMLESDGLAGTKEKLAKTLDSLEDSSFVVIAVDMFAGTPCNVAIEAMYTNKNIRVLTGLNLPMVIEYSATDLEDVDELAVFLKDVGLESIKVVDRVDFNVEEGGYED